MPVASHRDLAFGKFSLVSINSIIFKYCNDPLTDAKRNCGFLVTGRLVFTKYFYRSGENSFRLDRNFV